MILELIRSGEADALVSHISPPQGTRHFAVRYHDRTLGDAAREDFIKMFKLRKE